MIVVIMMFQSLARGKLAAGYSCPSVPAVTSLTNHISFVTLREGKLTIYDSSLFLFLVPIPD
jgi:hypothetical protein